MDYNQINDVKDYLNEIVTKCSDNEIQTLFLVLNKIEDFEKCESKRKKELHREMNYFRKIVTENEKQSNCCSLCNSLFIIFINPLYICQKCNNEVCRNCTIFIKLPTDIQFCKLCHKEWLEQVKSGNWLLEMARTKNRQTTVLERNSKIPIIHKEIEKKLQENSEFNKIKSAKRQLDNMTKKRDPKKILTSYVDETSSSQVDLRNSESVETLSKSYPASSNKSRTLNRNSYEVILDEPQNNQFAFQNLNSICITDKTNPNNISKNKSRRSVVDDLSQENNSHNGDILQRTTNLLRTPRSSANSYSSINSTELFTNDVLIQGEILMKIEYVQHQGVLKIRIIRCRNLSVANTKENSTNPYVKLYLLPDKSKSGKRKTTVKKSDKNPLFEEEFVFRIDKNSVISRTLNISVWHYEHMKMNIFLGESSISICNIKLNDPQEVWYSLKTRENIPHTISLYQYKGEILIGLQFKLYNRRRFSDAMSEYNTGVFNIYIKNGKYLGDEKNIPSTFVRCAMHHLHINIGKKETKTVSNTTNPIWDEIFSYPDIEKDGLRDTEIELFVLNKRITKTEFLGKLVLSNSCKESPVSTCREKDVLLWRKFLNTTNDDIVEDYLPMRSITE